MAWLAAINKLIDYEEARLQAKNRTALDQAATGWQQMLAATPQDRRPAGRDRLARLDTVG